MIYTERKVSIKNDKATIDSPIILFRGDREVEIMFTIVDSKFKFESNKGNVIDKTQATFGQLAVALPDGTDLFTEIVETQNGVVVFSITGEMIDEIHEVGFYSFHIRLYNDDKTSRITLPPVMEGIEIKEPLIIEGDVENTDLVGDATVGYSMVQTVGADEEVFDEDGNYIPTVWGIGDKITAEKLNKIEEGISSNVLKKESVKNSHIADKQISWNKTDFVRLSDRSNLIQPDAITLGYWINSADGTVTSNQYTAKYCVTDFMLVKPGNAYSYRTGYSIFSANVYDENKTLIRTLSYPKSIIIDENEAYVRLCFKNLNDQLNELVFAISKKEMADYRGTVYEWNNPEITDDVSVRLSLPDEYNLVVNDTFELFYKGVILANNPYNYNLKIECDKGYAYSKRYVYKPTISDVGTHTIEFTLLDDYNKELDYKEVVLNVNNTPSLTVSKNILIVGDSLTAGGERANELKRRLTTTGTNPICVGMNNLNFIGTCEKDDTKFEGYGGWTFNDYNGNARVTESKWIAVSTGMKGTDAQHSQFKDSNDNIWKLETIDTTNNTIKIICVSGDGNLPNSGSLVWHSGECDQADIVYTYLKDDGANPFWFNDKVDFAAYAESQGVDKIDFLNVLLGWNSTGDSESAIKGSARTFINNVIASFPECKIALLGIQVPSHDGIGANYGCAWNYHEKLTAVMNLNKWYNEVAKEYENVSFIHISSQFDSENNVQTSTRTVNVRNTKTEVYGSNGVHPALEGYLQIADAEFRYMIHVLQS